MARGNIETRGPNTYRIRIYLGKNPDGTKRYHRETFHGTKKQAEKRLTEILRALDTGGYVEPTKMTVGEWMERWLRDYAKPNTKVKLPRFGGHLIIRRRLHMPRPVLQPTAFRILPDSYSQDWSEAAYGCRIPRCSRRRQLVTANGLSTSVCQEARFAE